MLTWKRMGKAVETTRFAIQLRGWPMDMSVSFAYTGMISEMRKLPYLGHADADGPELPYSEGSNEISNAEIGRVRG